jgi:hypothetical protein
LRAAQLPGTRYGNVNAFAQPERLRESQPTSGKTGKAARGIAEEAPALVPAADPLQRRLADSAGLFPDRPSGHDLEKY